MVSINWNLLLAGPSPAEVADGVWKGFERGRALRQERDLHKARKALAANPDDVEARGVLASLDPRGLAFMEDAAYQRGERDRDTRFRGAFSDYLLADPGRPEAPPNALLGVGAPAAPAAAPPSPGSALSGLASTVAGLRDPGEPPALSSPLSALGGGDAMAGAVSAFGGQQPNALLPPQASAAPPAAAAPRRPMLFERTDAFRRMAQANPEQALAVKATMAKLTKAELETYEEINRQNVRLIAMAQDQPSYEAAKERARAMYAEHGLDPGVIDQLPAEYDPDTIHRLRMEMMDEKELIAALRAERRLEWDIEDDRADNRRADEEARSRSDYRRESIKVRRDRPARGARPAAARAPTKANVVGRLLDKKARGETLTPAEQQVLSESGGIDERRRLGEGTIIELQDGTRQEKKGGRWVTVD